MINVGYVGPQSCAVNGLHQRKGGPRRVFDVVLFSHELDLLEVRLAELGPVVTAFVIVESPLTFSGHKKRMFLRDELAKGNDGRFAPWADRIAHYVADDPPVEAGAEPLDAWSRERHHRAVAAKALKEAGARYGKDLVVFGDVDEIPRAASLRMLSNCGGWEGADQTQVVTLQSRFYIFSFEFEQEVPWHYPNVAVHLPATARGGVETVGLRRDWGLLLPDAGWHCTFCFRDPADRVRKLKSYSHTEKNTRGARSMLASPEAVEQAYCNGEDAMGVFWADFRVRTTALNVPKHVLKFPDRFAYLLPSVCNNGTRSVETQHAYASMWWS